MPIKGLTDRGAMFPEIGVLRKGAAKPETGNKPGADLKYFRFDSADEDAVKAFKEIYGNEPTSIRIFLPFETANKNFEAWREEWSASSLKHRCDGETVVLALTSSGAYSTEPKQCPGGCKQAGRLKVIIPELKRMAYVTVLTTSIHDILTIQGNLEALEQIRGSLQGIPMILKRVPREISTPVGDGKRARREKWLITIEAQPSWVELQLSAQERAALPSGTQLALPPDPDEDDDEETAASPAVERKRTLFRETCNELIGLGYKRKQIEAEIAASCAGIFAIDQLSESDLDGVIADFSAMVEKIREKKAAEAVAA